MKKYLLIVVILFSINVYAKSQLIEMKDLKMKILKQIELDKIEQDSIIILFNLTVTGGDKESDLSKLQLIDSTNFVYIGGWNLRVYLMSSLNSDNTVVLKINSREENWDFPQTLMKRIELSKNDSMVTYFQHKIKFPEEWFNVILSLNKNRSGCAMAIFTISP